MALSLPAVVIRDEAASTPPGAGSLLLVCFPSAGLASTIVGHYLVRALKLPRIATVQSPLFPSASVIVDGLPSPPVRIYGNAALSVVLSEFPAPPPVMGPMAQSILQWADGRKIGLVVAVEGVLDREATTDPAAPKTNSEPDVLGIPTDDATRTILQGADIPLLEEGIVGGTAAELLNEAVVRKRGLITLFAQSRSPDFPDHRAAAHLLSALGKIQPDLKIDAGPLLAQAGILEQAIRAGLKLHQASSPKGGAGKSDSGGAADANSMFG